MAIVFEGKSKCPLCYRELVDNFMLFPNLISNMKDILYPFSDAGVHHECLNNNKFKSLILNIVAKNNALISEYRNVDNPRNIIVIGLLTSDIEEELHKFNFILLNKRQVWNDKTVFLRIATKFLDDGKWVSSSPDNNYLKKLVEKILQLQ